MRTDMKDKTVQEALDAFMSVIKNTKEYKDYQFQKEKVKRIPELKTRIDEFRKKSFQLQNMSESDNLMEDVERLQRENESLLENPLVSDFLQAELDFCRMMQDINTHIAEAIDFE